MDESSDLGNLRSNLRDLGEWLTVERNSKWYGNEFENGGY